MSKRIYVGNLPWSFGSEELEKLFCDHGSVVSAEVITDRATGRSRGFGFVEMTDPQDAEKAIEALNTAEVGGRNLTVNVARERPPRRDRYEGR